MSFGLIALGVIAALVYFGLAQRVLDRLRLTDTQALLFIALMIVGSFLTIPLFRGRVDVTVNVGGALVPLALAIYILSQAGTAKERWRGIGAAVGTGAVIWALVRFTDFGPHGGAAVIDPLWLFALVAGAIAYLLGRSRRSAFVAAVGGILLADVAGVVAAWQAGEVASFPIGGGGILDAIVIGAVVAVGLAELFGEARESLQGGPGEHEPRLQEALRGPGGRHENLEGEAGSERQQAGPAGESPAAGDSDRPGLGGGEPRD